MLSTLCYPDQCGATPTTVLSVPGGPSHTAAVDHGSDLAFTGSDVAVLAVVAAVLIALGVLLVRRALYRPWVGLDPEKDA